MDCSFLESWKTRSKKTQQTLRLSQAASILPPRLAPFSTGAALCWLRLATCSGHLNKSSNWWSALVLIHCSLKYKHEETTYARLRIDGSHPSWPAISGNPSPPMLQGHLPLANNCYWQTSIRLHSWASKIRCGGCKSPHPNSKHLWKEFLYKHQKLEMFHC